MKREVLIKDWEFAEYSGLGKVLVGRLVEESHPRLGYTGNHRIRTSPIVKFHEETSKVETENTFYVLVGAGKEGIANEMAADRRLPLRSLGLVYSE